MRRILRNTLTNWQEIYRDQWVFAHHSRDEYKELIEKHGGKNVGSISSKTSFILAGDNMGPSKLEKAQKLGVTIVSEEEFLQMIE